jgi:hypothetical protein
MGKLQRLPRLNANDVDRWFVELAKARSAAIDTNLWKESRDGCDYVECCVRHRIIMYCRAILEYVCEYSVTY